LPVRPLSSLCLKFTHFIDFTVFGYKYIANTNNIGYIYGYKSLFQLYKYSLLAMKNLIRQQYQHKFDENLMIKNIRRPKEGWIRTLRKALGMSSPQLARILGLGKAQVSQMERMEIDDRITLNQLRRVAEELDCELVYALVPRTSIQEMIRERADFKAKKIIEAVNQHMILESQQLDESSLNEQLNLETNRLIQDMPRDLWEE